MHKVRTQLLAIAAVLTLSSAAYAADIAVKAAPPAPAPIPPSWTGIYFGGDLGGAWMSDRNFTFADLGNAASNTCGPCTLPYSSPPLSSHNESSAFGGLFAGYNWQFSPTSGWGNWVVGVEGDISWSNLRASASGPLFSDAGPTSAIVPVPGSNLSFDTDNQWIATVRGRLGWLWTPSLLIYGTGGAAWGRFDNSADASCPGVVAGGCHFSTSLNGAPFS
jgi:outer membrane immunogenic protein